MNATPEELAKAKTYMQTALRTSSRADVWLEMADLQVSRYFFGAQFTLALALFAQHIGALELRGEGAETGAITSKREGDLSVSYAAGAEGDGSDLSSTSYGQQYQRLMNSQCRAPIVSGPGVPGGYAF